MCNAIPILSPFFLCHPYVPHSFQRISFFLVSLMHTCIKSSGFIGGKGPRPLKIVILPDKGQSLNVDFDHNYFM